MGTMSGRARQTVAAGPTQARRLDGGGVAGREALAAARVAPAMIGLEEGAPHGTARAVPECGSRDPALGQHATSWGLWAHILPTTTLGTKFPCAAIECATVVGSGCCSAGLVGRHVQNLDVFGFTIIMHGLIG